jgi:ATP dependent DNA ligase domain
MPFPARYYRCDKANLRRLDRRSTSRFRLSGLALDQAIGVLGPPQRLSMASSEPRGWQVLGVLEAGLLSRLECPLALWSSLPLESASLPSLNSSVGRSESIRRNAVDHPHHPPGAVRRPGVAVRPQAGRPPGHRQHGPWPDAVEERQPDEAVRTAARRPPPGYIFDGEIVALDGDGRRVFNDLLFGRREPSYVAFDVLFVDGGDVRAAPLKERKALLQKVARRYGMQRSEPVLGNGKAAFRAVCGLDLEGIVAKGLGDSLWPENELVEDLERRLFTEGRAGGVV